jgi:hypothetical protein
MRIFPLTLALLAFAAAAGEPPTRPSARWLKAQPQDFQVDRCVIYQENGGGSGMSDSDFFVKGKVVAAALETRILQACPEVPGRGIEQYTRAEFNRLALAYPCLTGEPATLEAQLGVVRLRVESWETPHALRAANAGRLYRGMYIDRALTKGMEIELEADLLGTCEP